MTIGSPHSYIIEGLKEGLSKDRLQEIIHLSNHKTENKLSYLHSLRHISHITNVHYVYLRNIIERNINPYDTFEIKKSNNKLRCISAPKAELKLVQRWILKEIISNIKPHWRCYSYHQDASILECAKQHLEAKWLIKMDIKDFFHSIQEGQVYQIFKQLDYPPLVAFELARLCTINGSGRDSVNIEHWINYSKSKKKMPYSMGNNHLFGFLPQGAPTSPQLSNIVFKKLDQQLQELAFENNLVFTRYADDLSFSTLNKDYSRLDLLKLIKKVSNILKRGGFILNEKKTKLIPPSKSKLVLGLNVDSNLIKLSKDYKKNLQFHVDGIIRFGIEGHASYRHFDTIFGMLNHVLGKINFAISVDPIYGKKIERKFKEALHKEGMLL